jgi:hypothetical protein
VTLSVALSKQGFKTAKIFSPSIQPPDVAGSFYNQIDQDAGIDEMIVDDKVVCILDEWPVHVRHPVDEHQHVVVEVGAGSLLSGILS